MNKLARSIVALGAIAFCQLAVAKDVDIKQFAEAFIAAEKAAWERGDFAALEALEHPDVAFQNINGTVYRGWKAHKQAIIDGRAGFGGAVTQEWKYLMGEGNMFSVSYKWTVKLPQGSMQIVGMATGRVRDGKLIEEWGASQTLLPDPKSAQYQSKGEQDRSYEFPGTDEKIAYHLYVPAKWTPSLKLPLVIVTHGAAQPSTAPFQRPVANPTLAKTAEERGYIVAAVTGYHANATGVGGWNVPYKMMTVPRPAPAVAAGGGDAKPAQAPPTAQDFERAEQDVLFVADLVAKEYNADPQRIYLMGNSSGGSAVWAYAAKYPQRWTAISPSAAPLEDASFPYEKLKKVPVLVVHGDKDNVMVFEGSEAMVEHAKAKGVDATWLPVAGGAHTDAWAQPDVIKQIFDFFDAHRKKG